MTRPDGTPVTYPRKRFAAVQVNLCPENALVSPAGCQDSAHRVDNKAVAIVHRRNHIDSIVPGTHAKYGFAIGTAIFIRQRIAPRGGEDDFCTLQGEDLLRLGKEPVITYLNRDRSEVGAKDRIRMAGRNSLLPFSRAADALCGTCRPSVRLDSIEPLCCRPNHPRRSVRPATTQMRFLRAASPSCRIERDRLGAIFDQRVPSDLRNCFTQTNDIQPSLPAESIC